MKIQRFFWWY